MVEGSILTICLFARLFLKIAREGEERQELLDFASGHGFVLSEERARRAVEAGLGSELRHRLEEATRATDRDPTAALGGLPESSPRRREHTAGNK